MVSIRRAVPGDGQKIGAVFDAAVREAWTYLGALARNPMFSPEEWDNVVIEHAPPNGLLVAIDETGNLIGFTAVHPRDGEMYLLFVHPEHAGRGVGRALLDAGHKALLAAGEGVQDIAGAGKDGPKLHGTTPREDDCCAN